jgi:hypothetical protein
MNQHDAPWLRKGRAGARDLLYLLTMTATAVALPVVGLWIANHVLTK